jgi:hypothetical protein
MIKTLIIFLLFPTFIFGQSLFENSVNENDTTQKKAGLIFNGYGRASAYGGSKLYDYSNVFGEFSLQAKTTKGKAFLFTDLRFRSGLEFNEYNTTFELKEAYAAYKSDKIDISLGQKIISWGKADIFNPTNNITPNNYFFLSAKPDDQKIPNFLLETKFYFGNGINLELIGIPFYKPSVYRYDLFDLEEYTQFTEAVLPEKTFENGSLAAKLNFEFPKIDCSLSWFRGYSPFYGFNLNSINYNPQGMPQIELNTQTYLKQTFGMDFSLPIKSWIVKAEIAYKHTTDYETNMYIPNPELYYIVGMEHNFWGFHLIGQYIGRYIFDFSQLMLPNPPEMQDIIYQNLQLFNRKIFYQQEKQNHAFSLSINKSFIYETLKTELAAYYNIGTEEWFIRPSVSYSLSDALLFTIGGFYSTGPENSIFEYSSDIFNGAFMELKMNF